MPGENDGVPPPNDTQRVNKLPENHDRGELSADGSKENSAEAGRDAPLLPDGKKASLDDGILDQVSRRSHRPELVKASLWVMGVLIANLSIVVLVLTFAFCRALAPESVAKASVAELVKWVDQAGGAVIAPPAPSASSVAPQSATPIRTQAQALKIEAKIFGEVRDSMVPLVALVSILALAITVILGTMLKAAFARPLMTDPSAGDEKGYPVPVLQALKELADSIKALFKN